MELTIKIEKNTRKAKKKLSAISTSNKLMRNYIERPGAPCINKKLRKLMGSKKDQKSLLLKEQFSHMNPSCLNHPSNRQFFGVIM